MRDDPKERVKRLLASDKEEMNEASRAAALRDFAHVAAEYFEVEGPPSMQIKTGRRGAEVTFSFRAVRVKNFTVLKN